MLLFPILLSVGNCSVGQSPCTVRSKVAAGGSAPFFSAKRASKRIGRSSLPPLEPPRNPELDLKLRPLTQLTQQVNLPWKCSSWPPEQIVSTAREWARCFFIAPIFVSSIWCSRKQEFNRSLKPRLRHVSWRFQLQLWYSIGYHLRQRNHWSACRFGELRTKLEERISFIQAFNTATEGLNIHFFQLIASRPQPSTHFWCGHSRRAKMQWSKLPNLPILKLQ